MTLYSGKTIGKAIFSSTRRKLDIVEQYILLATDYNSDNLSSFISCNGIVTNHGDRTSRVAALSRDMRKPAILVKKMLIDDYNAEAYFQGIVIKEFDYIAILALGNGEIAFPNNYEYVSNYLYRYREKNDIKDEFLLYVLELMV